MKHMQAVINYKTALDGFHFAGGRSYMMRSEKRSGSGPAHRSPAPEGKPPRKRKKRAGFFYKVFTMLLLLTLWPVGLMMLWHRKLRWGAFTKFLTSIVTLAACIVLLGFALTVNTGNPQYTKVQDNINSFLDVAADKLINFGDIASEQAEIAFETASNLGEALWESSKVDLANGIDAGVALGQQLKTSILSLVEGPETETDEPAQANAAPEATAAITAPTPEPTAEPTPEPTPEPLVFTVKRAADATVYYNEGGKCYHMTSACGSMQSSVEHTLGETLEESNHRCTICGTPDKAILDEEHIIWQDADAIAHLSDECSEFAGSWKLMPAAEAIEKDLLSCTVCAADAYLEALANGDEMTVEAAVSATATPAPTEEPTPEPTEAPAEAEPSAEAADSESGEPTIEALPAEETEAEPAAAETQPAESESVEIESEADETVAAEEATPAPATQKPSATTAGDMQIIVTLDEPAAEPSVTEEASATAEPAATEVPVPTEAPEPEVVLPNVLLKPAGEATVYHSIEGTLYHSFNRCGSMLGGGAYTLAECAGTHKACRACSAPAAELIGKACLWQDAQDLCHTSDLCSAFSGKYRLVLRDDALAAGFSGCTECHADEYLVPNTLINAEDVLP